MSHIPRQSEPLIIALTHERELTKKNKYRAVVTAVTRMGIAKSHMEKNATGPVVVKTD